MTEVYIPIAPQIEQGTITVKIKIMSQIARQDLSIDIEILVMIIKREQRHFILHFFLFIHSLREQR